MQWRVNCWLSHSLSLFLLYLSSISFFSNFLTLPHLLILSLFFPNRSISVSPFHLVKFLFIFFSLFLSLFYSLPLSLTFYDTIIWMTALCQWQQQQHERWRIPWFNKAGPGLNMRLYGSNNQQMVFMVLTSGDLHSICNSFF